MKRILLGILLASSLAMSGDLVKCSKAIDMQNKYHELYANAGSKVGGDFPSYDTTSKEYYKNKMKFYSNLGKLWRSEAKKECKGILDDNDYTYASTGNFRKF